MLLVSAASFTEWERTLTIPSVPPGEGRPDRKPGRGKAQGGTGQTVNCNDVPETEGAILVWLYFRDPLSKKLY